MNNLEPPAKGDVNRGTSFIIIAALFAALSLITTSVRVAVRSVKRQMGWDDFAISLATILVLVELVFNGLEYKEGAGRHAFYLSKEQQQKSLKWNVFTQYFLFIIMVPLRAHGRVNLDNLTVHYHSFCTVQTFSCFLESRSRRMLEQKRIQRRDLGPSWELVVNLHLGSAHSLEENFGITGANLALSRAVYVYWREDRSLPRGKRRYPQQSDLTGRGLRPTAGWSRNLYSSARSQDSVIPLEDTSIKKTTDLSVMREPRDELDMNATNSRLGGRTFFVEDRV
ncbi:MAG: hypothetical protein Q9170_003985 [Blastenia crenularia]